MTIQQRFRGYLPVVIDVETGGFLPQEHALLELAACVIEQDPQGMLVPGERLGLAIEPCTQLKIEEAALKVTGIDLADPRRQPVAEAQALDAVFQLVRRHQKQTGCHRAILVGHNAHFDLHFLNTAIARNASKRNPFHPFSVLDTVTLGALAYGHTVLAELCQRAGLSFDKTQAHSALYDAVKTAELFCHIHNQLGSILPSAAPGPIPEQPAT